MTPARATCFRFALLFLLFSKKSFATDACYDEEDTLGMCGTSSSNTVMSVLQTHVSVERAAKAGAEPNVTAIASQIQLSQGDPSVVLAGCTELENAMQLGAGITVASPDLQNAVVKTGVAYSAIQAMQTYPENFDLGLACASMLEHTCTWNAVNQELLGAAGGLEASLNFYKRFPADPAVLSSFANLGFFMDFDPLNVKRFMQLGGLDFFFDEARKYYSSTMMGTFQCICATQSLMKSKERMVELGYFPLTMKGMRDFSLGFNRGEAAFVMSYSMISKEEWLDEMYAEGVIPELLRLMADEPNFYDLGLSLDPLGAVNKTGMARIMHSAVSLLGSLSQGNATRRDAIHKAGGVQAITSMLQRVGDLRSTASFGTSYDVLEDACATLEILLGAGGEADLVTVHGPGPVEVVSQMMSQRSDQIPACSHFVELVTKSGSGI